MKVLFILFVLNQVYKLNNAAKQKTPNHLDLSTNGVENFDVSEKWPQCKDVLEDIQSQGNCGSSWAISVATSIRDRRCIKSGLKDPISAYDIMSCCAKCLINGKDGCDGGDHDSAFQHFINHGIVTGGAYKSHKGCMPYPIQPDLKRPVWKNTECVPSCESSYKKSYENDKIKGKGRITFSHNNKGVMEEIMKNGPVVAEFRLYNDLVSYKSGIYEHKKGKFLGHYYAKIVGWGKDEQPYWRAVASFGQNWGENGTFRIKRGNNEVEFESNIIAGRVADDSLEVKPTTTEIRPKTTVASQQANLDCQKITGYYYGTFQCGKCHFLNFKVQMQIKADISLKDKRVSFNFDNWNKTYTNGYHLKISNGKSAVRCKTGQNTPCSIPFNDLSVFTVKFRPYHHNYHPWLIHIKPLLNNKFSLINSVGNCATGLRNNMPHGANPSLYKSCFCCGDKYDPDPSLGCPASPWS